MIPAASTGIQQKVLDFLGQGLSPAVVASAVGCSQGYITQLLAETTFRDQVVARRTALLKQATDLDRGYEALESKLQEKLRRALPFMIKPRDVLEALKVVNGAKRRGSTELGQDTTAGAQVIEVRMPPGILQQFATVKIIQHNELNQIVQVGEQSLITAQPQDIRELSEEQGVQDERDGSTTDKTGTRSSPRSLPSPSTGAQYLGSTEISVETLK